MNIRETIENNEKLILCEKACFAANSKGRENDEPQCELRTDFQRDRDRIIHCSSFRRLKHKTQVFIAPEGDHYRTRLTHTLEVSQIARTIARALKLNEDLTEAIALGHDLGHTPFGHAGERALNDCLETGFHHYEQSVRVVEKLEKDGKGLNLTYEVKDGILCHTNLNACTLEGRIVKYADKIAYMNHDIDDAQKGGIITEEDIPIEIRNNLGSSKSDRIDIMVKSIIANGIDDIDLCDDHKDSFWALHEFMYKTVYVDPIAKGQESKVEGMIKTLFEYFAKHPEKMPQQYINVAEVDGNERAAADYIGGMSDRYSVFVYNKLFIPKFWEVY